jgi:lysophospholipase L1-like esterase
MKQNCWISVLLGMLLWSFHAAIGADIKHDFSKWENEISAFERMDRTNPPPKGAVLFTGSSTIRLWKTLAQDFADQPVINRGFGGCEIADCAHFAARIIVPYKPRMVFVRAGSNDIHAGKTPEQVYEDFKEFVAKVHAQLPETEIVFISLCPSVARWNQAEKEKRLNQMVEQYAPGVPHVKYIETYTMSLGPDGQPRPELFVADKLHFNSAGYRLLAERVRPFLTK